MLKIITNCPDYGLSTYVPSRKRGNALLSQGLGKGAFDRLVATGIAAFDTHLDSLVQSDLIYILKLDVKQSAKLMIGKTAERWKHVDYSDAVASKLAGSVMAYKDPGAIAITNEALRTARALKGNGDVEKMLIFSLAKGAEAQRDKAYKDPELGLKHRAVAAGLAYRASEITQTPFVGSNLMDMVIAKAPLID